MSELLTTAKDIAARAHVGQFDRFISGEIYYKHPLRVAAMVEARGGSEFAIIAAILHDVLEDAKDPDVFASEILLRFGGSMLRVVSALSRKEGETYMDYIRRTRLDPTTKLVKECDIDDHLDLKRLEDGLPFDVYSGIIVENEGMFRKYAKAKKVLMESDPS